MSHFVCRDGAATPPPHSGLGPAGLGGGYVGYGAAAVPSRPVLVTGSGSCTRNSKCFRNEMLNDLICDIWFDRTRLGPPSRSWAGGARR